MAAEREERERASGRGVWGAGAPLLQSADVALSGSVGNRGGIKAKEADSELN